MYPRDTCVDACFDSDSGLSAQLPFELRALEVCLDELASEYDALTTELEATAYPALDSLANKVGP